MDLGGDSWIFLVFHIHGFFWCFVPSLDFPGVPSVIFPGIIPELLCSQILIVFPSLFASLSDFIPKIPGFGAKRENPLEQEESKDCSAWICFFKEKFGNFGHFLPSHVPVGDIPGKSGFGSGIKSPLVDFPAGFMDPKEGAVGIPSPESQDQQLEKEFWEKKFPPWEGLAENSQKIPWIPGMCKVGIAGRAGIGGILSHPNSRNSVKTAK